MKLTPEDQKKLQDKELANIIRKLNGGKTLTAREEAKLAAASAGGQIDASGYVGTWDELGDRLGVTRRAIQDWRNDPRYKGEIEARWPRLTRADGRYCVAEWLQLMIDLHLKRGKAAAEAGNDPENDDDDAPGIIKPPAYGGSQSDWNKAKIAKEVERKAIEIDTLKGALLEADDLEVPLGATFAAIQSKLAQFPARVARYLVGLRDVGEVEEKLRDEIDADLADLHAARYTAEDTIAAALAAVPFDAETAALCEKLLFAGSDRTALLQLAGAIATEAVRRMGRQAIAIAKHDQHIPDTALADEKTGQVTDEAAGREAIARAVPVDEKAKVSDPVNSTTRKPKRKKKAKPQPTPPPGEIEAAIVNRRGGHKSRKKS